MRLLNLGCGQQYHNDWTNIDFYKSPNIIDHNLLKGIPFIDNEFDVVYHSHLLEHFSKSDGEKFIKECFRVLKPGGIIRIAVPDLEEIVKNYFVNLKGALDCDANSAYNYEWTMLELYDQAVRNISGGEMAAYLYRKDIPNKEFVFERIGEEGMNLHKIYLDSVEDSSKHDVQESKRNMRLSLVKFARKLRSLFFRLLFKNEYELKKSNSEALEIGKFRLSGEIHQWMYDHYSLSLLLKRAGFCNIRKVSAFESNIPGWDKFNLDHKDGQVRKPDSLFMEASK
jgi:predicted SAM-dependent methyltransferase